MKWKNVYVDTSEEDGIICNIDQIFKRVCNIQNLTIDYREKHKKRLV
jgi:hypothetical protein